MTDDDEVVIETAVSVAIMGAIRGLDLPYESKEIEEAKEILKSLVHLSINPDLTLILLDWQRALTIPPLYGAFVSSWKVPTVMATVQILLGEQFSGKFEMRIA
jgi:hypothetical protein